MDKRGGKGSDARLVHAHGAGQGVAAEPLHQLAPADDDTGLGPAQELIAGEHGQVGAGRQALLHCRLRGQAEAGGVQETAGAQVVEQQDAVLVGQPGQVVYLRRLREAHDAEVAGVDAHDGRGVRSDGRLVVAQVGAVGGAHLHQAGVRLAHHVGDAEAAADLHRLPTGDDHLAAAGQGGESEEDGRGVVVNGHGCLSTGELTQNRLQVHEAGAAHPCVEIELQVRVTCGDGGRGGYCVLGQGCPAEVGVDDDAGGVDERPQGRAEHGLGEPQHGLHELILGGSRPALGDGGAGGLQRLAHDLGDHRPLAIAQRAKALVGQQAVDGGESAEGIIGGHDRTVRQFYHILASLLDPQRVWPLR